VENKMKKKFALRLLAASLVANIATAGYAQNTTTTTTTTHGYSVPATPDQRFLNPTVLAGCLRTGPGADEYTLYGPRLQWWELKSDSVNLDLFVDLEVRVTVVKSPDNNGILTVTDLAVVMGSCN
jgi:hypothetical protein